MGSSYYYLLSSLPMLSLDAAPPLTVTDFMAQCCGQLPDGLAQQLESVSLLPDHAPCCAAERGWQVWETALRNVLVGLRAARNGRDGSSWRHPEADVFPGDRRRVEAACSGANPVVRERELDRLRWERLDDLAVGHDFDFHSLVIYKLRLLIVEKWRLRSPENGSDVRDSLVAHGVKQAEPQQETPDNHSHTEVGSAQ